MSEIHILDPAVRPESLCGYTGPPGEGDPTCAACIAVDEQLVYPGERWDRVRERVVFPVTVLFALAMCVAAYTGHATLVNVFGVLAGLVMLGGIPATVILEYRASRALQGDLVEMEA